MNVNEVMTHNIEWTGPTTTLADAARRMRDRNIGCLPVGEGDGFIGMLTEKDFTNRATAAGLDPTTTPVSQIMTHHVIYCLSGDSVEDALGIMRANKIRHLPVRDQETKRVVGIVSLTDLAMKAPSELYGDISKLAFRRTLAVDYAGQRAN
jgi:CBS domain-containing protein